MWSCIVPLEKNYVFWILYTRCNHSLHRGKDYIFENWKKGTFGIIYCDIVYIVLSYNNLPAVFDTSVRLLYRSSLGLTALKLVDDPAVAMFSFGRGGGFFFLIHTGRLGGSVRACCHGCQVAVAILCEF